MKRLLQTRAAHDRQVAAAQQEARAGWDRKATQDRDRAHHWIAGEERRWTRTWADRGTATPAKTRNDQTRQAGGIQPTVGDTVNPDQLAAAVDKRRHDKLMAVTLGGAPPTGRPPARGTTPGQSRGYTPPTPDRGRGHSR